MNYSNKHLNEYRKAVKAGFDPNLLAAAKFNVGQLHEMRLGKEKGLDTAIYANPVVTAEKMRTARMLMELGTEVKPEMLEIYNEKQLEEIRLGTKYGIDTNLYANPDLSADDMKHLRLLELAHKIIELIKAKSFELFDNIKDRLQAVSKANVPVKDDAIENATVSILKKIDFSKVETMEDLKNQVEVALMKDDVKLEVDETLEAEEVKNTYQVIDKMEFNDKRIAVLQNVDSKAFFVVHDFKEFEDCFDWGKEISCSSKEIAGKVYQEAILDELSENLNVNIKVAELPKELSASDLEIKQVTDSLITNMIVKEVQKVDKFMETLGEELSVSEKMNLYLQTDSLLLKSYSAESQNLSSLKGQFAQTYLKETGLEDSLKAQGLYDCLNLEDYGQKLIDEQKVILTEKGYYGPLDLKKFTLEEAKAVIQENSLANSPISMNLKIDDANDIHQVEQKFNDAIKNYLDMEVKNPLNLSLNLGDQQSLITTNLTYDNVRSMHFDATLNRISDFKQLLQTHSIDYEQIQNETLQEIIEVEPVSVPIN